MVVLTILSLLNLVGTAFLRRFQKKRAMGMHRTNTAAPTVPPTIAPIFFVLVGAGDGFGGGEFEEGLVVGDTEAEVGELGMVDDVREEVGETTLGIVDDGSLKDGDKETSPLVDVEVSEPVTDPVVEGATVSS